MYFSLKDLRRPRHLLTVAMLCVIPVIFGCASDAASSCADLLEASDYEGAADVCEQVFEEIGDPGAGSAAAQADYYLGRQDDALSWPERLEGTSGEAMAWGVAAAVHRQRGDTALEQDALERRVALHLEADEHYEASRTYYFLFLTAWAEADFRDQIEYLRLSYEAASRAEDRDRQATAIQGLISPLLGIGDLNGAKRALRAADELLRPDPGMERAYLSNSEGIIRNREGQSLLAIDAFETALRLDPETTDRGFLRAVYLNLVDASVRAGRIEDAQIHLESAWDNAEPEGRNQSALLYYRSLVSHAREDYETAIDAAHAALSQDPESDWEWELAYQLGRSQEAAGDLEAAEAAYRRAADSVEQLRRSLGSDELKSWLMDHKREPFESLFRLQARAGRVHDAIETLERAKARTFLDALIQTASTTPDLSGVSGLIDESTQRFEGLQELLPMMIESPVVELRPIETVLAAFGDKNVLIYFKAGNEIWLISLLAGRPTLRELPASAEEISALVDQFLASPDDPETAVALGETLVPRGTFPEAGSEVLVVADGFLGRLPFAALRPRGRYLVQDHVISYVSSLNAVVATNEQAQLEYGPAVVLGDPKGDLPAAASEAAEVADLLGVVPHIGLAATSEWLERGARARVLHLATHTGLGVHGPWLALADQEIGAAELLRGPASPRLVVLATCASAAREGDDLWGSLAAAFLTAGSDAVLASLWSVEDRQAREFIRRFYVEGGADNSALALAAAQRAFIAAGKPTSFWGPFVHFGSQQALQNP